MMNEDKYRHLAPPIPISTMNTRDIGLTEQIKLIGIEENEELLNAQTFREQIWIIANILYGEGKPNLTVIAKIFGCKPATVKRHLKQHLGKKPNGRPSVLPADTAEFIVQLVREQYEKRCPINYDFLQDALWKKFNVSVLPDTLRHYCKNISQIKAVDGIPMEKQRIDVNPEDIRRKYEELEEHLRTIPGEFVFNVDETGCSDWADAQCMKVLVPSEYDKTYIKYPKDRNAKRASLVGCIVADGDSLCPLVILPRKTIESEVEIYGYKRDKVRFAYQEHSFMTTKIFDQWASEIFFPYVEEKRARLNYQGEALIILDGLAAHNSPWFIDECEKRMIRVFFLVPHSSDQTQPLDLLIFSLVKRAYSRSTFKHLVSAQSNQIAKIIGAWYQSVAPHLVVLSFMASGMKPSIVNGFHYYSIDMTLATKVRDWEIGESLINDKDATKRTQIHQKSINQ